MLLRRCCAMRQRAEAPEVRDTVSVLPLVARGLRFAAGGVEIIRELDLIIEPGAPTLILGPNGAGKSVLLRLLHGLLEPGGGTLAWALPAEEAQRRQGMVFQR